MNSDSRAALTASVLAAAAMLLVRMGGCDVPPVVPPGPNPPPVVVDPPPQPTGEYRVLIIEETSARSTLKPEQLAILTSAPFRAWLGQQGAAARFVDQDVDQQFMDAKWQAMLKEQRQSLPWLIVTGKGQFSGPLPGTVAETEAIVGRYKP